MTTRPVASPCVSICALDEDDICVGCYRSDQEIMQWREMDDDQRRQVIDAANQRAASMGRGLGER
ncbi:DUF1289 domain-containing protein [Aestuariirhabdus sp. Z084]|uniref:DUF1289 domain-containing protein n=1 Tax=Aestuariirhabdus haliotis TaxID=2918751 RepID=UPI00201B3BE5|nr:DUF1289 domain-containing protein [Aestuariirhabdus haliotis]MCL6415870.1 DUF1289 domain-containing protein [Aestuariirhabdus haliotis]MCL6419828.1 DUF1289 domain-containing protein [Aestuariirhabdus haliotis]